MKTLSTLLLGTALLIMVQACTTQRETGALTGAAVGTAAGAAIDDSEGAVIGGLLGTIVGHEVGMQMQREDRLRTSRALENNRTGESTAWVNPDTGREYRVTPEDTFRNESERPCREFDMVSEYRGERVRTTEVACRQPDGTWEIIG